MKTKISILILFAGLAISTKAQDKSPVKDTVITVYGDCDNCKTNIERACSYVKGVKRASWDKDAQKLTLVYREDKVKLETIEQAIAKAGYDTQNFKADEKAYEALPACCHYRTVEKH